MGQTRQQHSGSDHRSDSGDTDLQLKFQLEGSDTNVPGSSSISGASAAVPFQPGTTPTVSTAPSSGTAVNYKIKTDAIGEGTAHQRFQRNLAAIRCLKRIEAENRFATPAEQEILAQYVGWGGLADVFDERHSGYNELRSRLTDPEYVSAKASTLNAHYTTPVVIRAMFDTIRGMGFKQGKILEPSMGIGNFFGALPVGMMDSDLYGVELDSLSGRIARQLYPNAHITIAGFETTKEHDFYDLAIGNVPFGQIKVNDPQFNKWNFSIHNYFFAKAIEQVRPGGIIAFLTSRYTLDAKSSAARKYIAQRAELLGAVRLPNTAFKAAAGTEVVADILFLQKRDTPIVTDPDWLYLDQTETGFTVNRYFVDHPEMILGKMVSQSTQYGKQDFTVDPLPDSSLVAQLFKALSQIPGKYLPASVKKAAQPVLDTLPGDPTLMPWSYTLRGDTVYFQEDGNLVRQEVNNTAAARIRGLCELRDCVRGLIALQLAPETTDADLQEARENLNRLYDGYVKDFGRIGNQANRLAFKKDSAYPLLISLELTDDDGIFTGKADIFFRRTIKPNIPVTHVDTAAEALAVSIGEKARVDIDYMASLSGKAPETLENELSGVIFRDIVCNTDAKRIPFADVDLSKYPLVTADEYLSGNVRQKLRMAKAMMEALPIDKRKYLQPNVDALEKAQPKDLQASEIFVRLGATWIPPEDIRQFIVDSLSPPTYTQFYIKVRFSALTGEWQIEGKNMVSHNDVNATVTYGTSRINAYELIERTLNMREVRIYDVFRDSAGERRVLNTKETTLAQQRQQLIQDKFRDWIWEDPERRQRLVSLYNEKFNSTRPREYDGSHITFGGINPEIQLRPHQLGAIAHILYGGNTLLAHVVGAGKTYEMVAAVMESKRLGLCQKAMIAVPNHLTEQWGTEFLRLYPAANILVAKESDFTKDNRRKFFGRIATGDYDAIIIGHSQFERIPVSVERQKAWLTDELQELAEGIDDLKSQRGEGFTIKQLERAKKNLEVRLEKLVGASAKDHVVTFEELGIDRLFVDEAHAYKNLFCYTKMTRVAGLSTAESQRSADMLMKCRYLDEKTGGRGIVFATGTPVSNSMVELYTMQRYLQNHRLQELGLTNFDAWASVFGETVTAMELAPEGTGYRSRTRFAKFYNLPELMSIFKEVADIKVADQLNLPTPEAVYETHVCKPTIHQQEMVKELSQRAAEVHTGTVDPSIDNMLKITSDGRKLGLDQRLIEPLLPDESGTKINRCVEDVLQFWKAGAADKLTQLIFCDLSTPKDSKSASDTLTGLAATPFSVYDDLRKKLIAGGIPPEQIAFIHDANTTEKKKKLFCKVRSGDIRVLIGSTQKMGAGTNVQDRLIALHDLDCPWRPGDLEQRAGRIVRQGNCNSKVYIKRYVTEGTFDAYLWQTVENKQKFISQIMTSKSPIRAAEDVDDAALSYAEIKALCAGDPRIKEKMDLDVSVAKLRLLKASYQSQRYALQDQLLRTFPEEIVRCKGIIDSCNTDLQTIAQHPEPPEGFVGIELDGQIFRDKLEAGQMLLDLCKRYQSPEPKRIGVYRGLQLYLQFQLGSFSLVLQGQAQYLVSLGSDARGNLLRISNVIENIPQRIRAAENQLEHTKKQIELAHTELEKPFPQEAEYLQKSQRLVELNAQLDMDSASKGEEITARGSVELTP